MWLANYLSEISKNGTKKEVFWTKSMYYLINKDKKSRKISISNCIEKDSNCNIS